MCKNHLSQWLLKVAVVALLTFPGVARAQTDASRGLWMAASSSEASLAGRDFGRLTMTNGVLAFKSSSYEWSLTLPEIKRIAVSKTIANALEVESLSGQVHYVGILNGQLTMTSPAKAVQLIQRALKTAPAPAPSRTMAAAGGGTQ